MEAAETLNAKAVLGEQSLPPSFSLAPPNIKHEQVWLLQGNYGVGE